MQNRIFIFITIYLLFGQFCYGQTASIKKTWIGNNLEYLKISDTTVVFDYGYFAREYNYKIVDNNFTIIYYDRATGNDLKQENELSYEIIKLVTDTLILKPLSHKAQGLIGGQDYLVLIDSANTSDKNFKFEKIFFSSIARLGTSAQMKIEIDSTGKVFFLGERNIRKYKGLYHGQLKPKDLAELKLILQNSCLDNFPTELNDIWDAPSHNFVFYYNGKKKESSGVIIPYFSQPLLNFLRKTHKIASLKKYRKPYTFEK